ncbi:MAG: glycosyltransferase [Candidatus Daviesbacteria bacterium]|nr:glycosyltransferase [Candidatus Daviesbacteria bacterium]
MIKTFHIFANAALGKGLSGSDRIFIEFAKKLNKEFKVVVHVWEEGYLMCKRQGLENVEFEIMELKFWNKYGFFICYLARIVKSIWYGLFAKMENSQQVVLYSASEFWMDSIGVFILKLRFPKIRWVAAWFQTAPNPIFGFSSGNRETKYRLSAFYYWLMQLPVKPLIAKFADFILVNNELEKSQFPHLNKLQRVLVILGAVNTENINKYLKKYKNLPKIYDGVFQGRFHPQKGVVELIEIWKLVTKKIPSAKLALIGDGPLMDEVKLKIKQLKLENNIQIFGYVFDGSQKYKIFASSKIVVHPAFFDSGGMAAGEGMFFGLPGVGFNLDSYQSYYPMGMVKVKVGDLKSFSGYIIRLIKNKDMREKIGNEARKMIKESWSWDERVNQLLIAIS